ncbi:VOC family protein [Streptomyces sp. cg40]|uniref:VOC family protein n=1 Tax=Streptomyces sp. cg40 TaxID=3419764 RepID=UPI003D083375
MSARSSACVTNQRATVGPNRPSLTLLLITARRRGAAGIRRLLGFVTCLSERRALSPSLKVEPRLKSRPCRGAGRRRPAYLTVFPAPAPGAAVAQRAFQPVPVGRAVATGRFLSTAAAPPETTVWPGSLRLAISTTCQAVCATASASIGATMVDRSWAEHPGCWVIMRDPSGQDFCVVHALNELRPQADRDDFERRAKQVG